MVAASTVVSANDRLLSCELIPKLLCCTEYISDKCLIDYVIAKCPYKMQNQSITKIIGSYQKIESKFCNQQTTSISITVPITFSQPITRNVRRQSIKKSMLFVEPNSSSEKLFDPLKGHHINSGLSRHQASTYQIYDDYMYLNQRYPIIDASDSNLSSDRGIENSRSLHSPYLPRKLADELFLTCCQQHAQTNCHSLCTYKHRKSVAMETLIEAIQQNTCDPKYHSSIFRCANRNRNNRNCCQFLEMASPELEVSDRCHRMCNIAQSGDRIITVEKTIWSISATGMFSSIAHALAYVRSTKKIQ
uniref:DB domain-containing protein n=1 Tax=Elaeophora elaphi TaxID=1147741 RepID=A0A0R3RIV0_9BILA